MNTRALITSNGDLIQAVRTPQHFIGIEITDLKVCFQVLKKKMGQLIWDNIFVIVIALLTTVIPSTKSKEAEIRVYRFSSRDVFKNPEYSSYTDCGEMTCTKYEASCLDDGNCCLCRCKFKFSTYNVSEARCVSDKTTLAGKLLWSHSISIVVQFRIYTIFSHHLMHWHRCAMSP